MMRVSRVRFSAWVLAVVLLGIGCDSVRVDGDGAEVAFVLLGSIDSEFSDGAPEFSGTATFSRSGIANRLNIALKVVGASGDREERADLSFRFAYASNSGELPPGHYSVVPDEVVSSIGEGYYESIGPAQYSRYGFRGTSLKLDVEDSAPGRIVAQFSFQMEQTQGERLVDGQQIVVELAGPVTAQGSFDLVIDGLEFSGEV